jgi:hypothetical protein
MKHNSGPNKAHRIWSTSLADWDRPIRNWLFTEEHKTKIVQGMWQNEFAILQHIVRIFGQPNAFGLSFPSPRRFPVATTHLFWFLVFHFRTTGWVFNDE